MAQRGARAVPSGHGDKQLHVVKALSCGPPVNSASLQELCALREPFPKEKADMASRFVFDVEWRSPDDCKGQLRTVQSIFVKLLSADIDPEPRMVQKVRGGGG